jgi:hypothetical protein
VAEEEISEAMIIEVVVIEEIADLAEIGTNLDIKSKLKKTLRKLGVFFILL